MTTTDLARLVARNYNAFGIEPAVNLREAAAYHHPELSDRIASGSLPDQLNTFGGSFDGVLCRVHSQLEAELSPCKQPQIFYGSQRN